MTTLAVDADLNKKKYVFGILRYYIWQRWVAETNVLVTSFISCQTSIALPSHWIFRESTSLRILDIVGRRYLKLSSQNGLDGSFGVR